MSANNRTSKAVNRTSNRTNRKAVEKATAAPAPLPIYDTATGRLNMPVDGYASLEAYRDAVAAAYAAGFQAIDAAAAYMAVEQFNNAQWRDEHAAAMTALHNLITATTCVLRTLQNAGRRTGTSSIYNVIDGRVIHGVNIGRKSAQRLGGSRMFARFCEQFIAVRIGNEQTRRTSANGEVFTVDRRQFVTA